MSDLNQDIRQPIRESLKGGVQELTGDLLALDSPGEYRVYGASRIRGTTENGGCLEWTYGCNDEKHVHALTEVFYDGDGMRTGSEHIRFVEVGVCDKMCQV